MQNLCEFFKKVLSKTLYGILKLEYNCKNKNESFN